MGHAIPVRTDYTAGEVRRFAQRAKDAAQARRLLAIAAVLEGRGSSITRTSSVRGCVSMPASGRQPDSRRRNTATT